MLNNEAWTYIENGKYVMATWYRVVVVAMAMPVFNTSEMISSEFWFIN